MPTLRWECYRFSELSNENLYELLKLRVDVFIVEQNCPYPELDNKDRHNHTQHLLAFNQSQLIAYSRLLAPEVSYPETSIGRFVVHEDWRQQGVGTSLLTKSIEQINQTWPQHDIRISAQEYLQAFYQRQGFKKVSECYLEDGIPHIEMLKQL